MLKASFIVHVFFMAPRYAVVVYKEMNSKFMLSTGIMLYYIICVVIQLYPANSGIGSLQEESSYTG
jgi:hypothetical protein